MRPQPQAAPRQLNVGDKATLRTKAQVIRRDAINGSRSVAMRSRMNVQVNQLCSQVLDLDPPELVAAASMAIRRAWDAHAWDDLAPACEAFEQALDGKAPPAPAADPPPPVPAPIAATPAPPAAPVPDPVADQDGREPDQADPEKDRDDAPAPAPTGDVEGLPAAALAGVEQLGETIRLARARKRMTQQEVATAAGVGRRLVVELESGKGKSDIGRVFAVCQVVGVALTATAS